jgi:hypothetical protein
LYEEEKRINEETYNLTPSRKGSRDPHQFPLLSAWKKG